MSTHELLRVATEVSGVTDTTVASAIGLLLGAEFVETSLLHDRSALNNDGYPLQLCITVKGASTAVRLIGDPAYQIEDSYMRVAYSRKLLEDLLKASDLTMLQPAFDELIYLTLPQQREQFNDLEVGGMWIATGLGSSGAAVYTTATWGQQEHRWERALRWLDQTLPNSEVAQDTVQAIHTHTELASTALEGRQLETMRAKVYFRLTTPKLLDDLNVSFLSNPLFSSFLMETIEDQAISRAGLVLSLGFSVANGELTDAKVDVCGCSRCLARSPNEWIELMMRVSNSQHNLPPSLLKAISDGAVTVAFLGTGIDKKDRTRLNIYLKN